MKLNRVNFGSAGKKEAGLDLHDFAGKIFTSFPMDSVMGTAVLPTPSLSARSRTGRFTMMPLSRPGNRFSAGLAAGWG